MANQGDQGSHQQLSTTSVSTSVTDEKSSTKVVQSLTNEQRELIELKQRLFLRIQDNAQSQRLQNALYKILELAYGSEDIFAFYESLHKIVNKLLFVNNFYVALLSETQDTLDFAYFVDENDKSISPIDNPKLALSKRDSLTVYLYTQAKTISLNKEQLKQLTIDRRIKIIGTTPESLLASPLVADGLVIGVIVVQSYSADMIFSNWQRELFAHVSNTLSSALVRKKRKILLEKDFSRKTEKLLLEIERRHESQKIEQVLFDISNLANSKIALEDFYLELHREVATLIYAENFFIVLKKPGAEKIEFVYYKDIKDKMTVEDFGRLSSEDIKNSLTAKLFNSGQSLLTEPSGIRRFIEIGEIIQNGVLPSSWLGVPLRIDDEVIGALVLQSYDAEKIFSNKDKQLVEYISRPVANAIQRKSAQFELEKLVNDRTRELKQTNLELRHQIDEKIKAEKLQFALYEIASLATGAEDMYEFFCSLHRILKGLFNTDNFYVALADSRHLNILYARDEKDGNYLEGMSLDISKNTLSTLLYRANKPFLLNAKEFKKLAFENRFELIGSQFESWLGVTLKEDSKPIGIMVIQSYRKQDVYHEWHRDLLEFVAQHVAIAIHRKKDKERLEEMVRERTAELQVEIEDRKSSQATQSALYQIANLASRELDPDLFYKELHGVIASLVYSENFFIAIKDDESDSIRMAYYVDNMDDLDVNSISEIPKEKLKNSLTGYVMNLGKSFLATGQQIEELTFKHNLELIGVETISWLGIPLVVEGQTIGIMTLQSYTAEHCYSEKDRSLMLFVGQHVATSLQRKKNKDNLNYLVEVRTKELNYSNELLRKQILVAETSKKLQTALFQITELASSAQDMEELYVRIHHIISQFIYAKNFYICLYDSQANDLEFVYFVDTVDSLNKDSVKNFTTEELKSTGTGKVLFGGRSILRTPYNDPNGNKASKNYLGKRSLYWLGVPLKIENKVIGVITVQSYDIDSVIGEGEKELLEFVSQQIALTLERKQNHDALERRVIERTAKLAEMNSSLKKEVRERQRSEAVQAALYDITNLANTASSLQELFAEVHKVIGNIIYAKNFYICLWNKVKDDMDWLYFVDADENFDYRLVDALPSEIQKNSLARLVFSTQKILHVGKNDIFRLQDEKKIVLMGPASEHYLGVPLFSAIEPIGVMAVQSYDREREYSEADETLLAFVAQSIVSAIERRENQQHLEQSVIERTQELTISNNLLKQEILQRKEAVELQRALFKISETPQSCVTEEQLYSRLHKIIGRLMLAKSFYIAWADDENNVFRLKYIVDEFDEIGDSIPLEEGLTGYVYRRNELTHLNREEIIQLEIQKELICIGTKPVDWVGVPLVSGGKILGIMALQSYDDNCLYGKRELDILNFVSTHIAEALQRKYAEKKLSLAYTELAVKTQKAEEASMAKSTFLATVSHEIRTPMNGILGMLSLLSDTTMSLKQQDYVSKISISAKSLLGIINDILDFSKIEQGKLELEKLSFNMMELVDDLIDIFAIKSNEKKLDFNIDLHSNVQLERLGDSLRLSQVLINLIGNAIKFTKKGFVHLTITEIKPGTLEFDVEDSGIGIAESKREKIFQSFTQADDATTRKYGGSGLGLSICQQLVSMMGGEILVSGKLGKGSRFSFSVNVDRNPRIKKKASNLHKSKVKLFTNSIYRLSTWKNFCLRFNIELHSRSLSELEEMNTRNRLIPEEDTHVFVDCDDSTLGDLNLNELLNKLTRPTTSCFILSQPQKMLSELASQISDITIIPKPVKMSAILKLLSSKNKSTQLFSQDEKDAYADIFKTVKILLVEDNVINQQVAREMLEKADAQVSIAHNGKVAVDMLGRYKFDLVLMDVQMPVMDGYTATEYIRSKLHLTNLPIIAMTANVMKGDKEKCLNAGMNGYIGKPIEKLALFNIISANLAGLKSFKPPINIQLQTSEAVLELNQESLIEEKMPELFHKFGDEDLVRELLRMFVDIHRIDSLEVLRLIDEGDLLKAQKRVHKLKGSSCELEMNELNKALTEIEQMLKNHQKPVKNLLNEFEANLQKEIEKIDIVLNSGSSDES